jgi:hypothetical protein
MAIGVRVKTWRRGHRWMPGEEVTTMMKVMMKMMMGIMG